MQHCSTWMTFLRRYTLQRNESRSAGDLCGGDKSVCEEDEMTFKEASRVAQPGPPMRRMTQRAQVI
jgi:hypothetical protein